MSRYTGILTRVDVVVHPSGRIAVTVNLIELAELIEMHVGYHSITGWNDQVLRDAEALRLENQVTAEVPA